MKLLVLGASGGCGRWLVRLGLERSHLIRAVVRPSTHCNLPDDAEVIRGEVLEPGVIDQAVQGCDAVVSALGIQRKNPLNPWSALASPRHLTTRVARQLVESMGQHSISRLVVISAGGVGDSFPRTHPLVRWMIRHSNMAASYEDLNAMEQVLAGSSLDWMAVRPTTLANGPPQDAGRQVERYGLLSRIRRSDVAGWMLDAIGQPGQMPERTPLISG